MSTGKRNNTRPTVSSVGNAWIVCHSKSHPNHVYYFNTVTREAVWNLSEAEIERARITTQILQSQSAKPVLPCPEPKDNPPPEATYRNQFQNANAFNQRMPFEENMFQQQQGRLGMLPTQKQPGPVYSAINVGDLSAFDFNALRNQINAFNVMNTPAVYNHSPWAIQPPFLITPTIPIVNQNQAAMHVGYNSILQNDNHQPEPRNNSFNNSPLRRPRPFEFNSTEHGDRFKRFKKPLPKNDLRQRLALKRRLSCEARKTEESTLNKSNEETPVSIGIKKKTADVSAFIAELIEDVTKENYSTDDNITAPQNEEIPLKLDLEPLKSLASMNAILKNWHIVVDLDVLLHQYNFLNCVADSDEQCTLMVPESVMSELKDYIACSNNIPARRIYHDLVQRIESGLATLGLEPKQDCGDSITNPILKTCFSLLEENFHLILVTNDSELLRYKKFIKVHIFTVDEIKTCLEYDLQQHRPKSISNSPISTSNLSCHSQIKITIPGKATSTVQSVATETTQTESIIEEPISTDTVIEEKTRMESDPEPDFCGAENSQTGQVTVPLKCTADAAIQTDISDSYPVNDNVPIVRHNEGVGISNKSDAMQECSSNIPIQTESNIPVRRREIKLKRTINGKPPEPPASDKERKPFRWRRNRNNSQHISDTTVIDDKPSEDCHNNVTAVSPIKNTVNNDKKDNVNESPSKIHATEELSAGSEVVESAESSLVNVSTRRDNITVEETSTSGINSIAESNIDAEYVSYKHKLGVVSRDESNHDASDMQIDSEVMEESLKTKGEEWVSRFIQIMEDVLQVVLYKEKAFSNSELPPPWSLHEAAQCIGKYSNVTAVKRASDKLSSVLFYLSDASGKILSNMTPSQYMEMYRCGVFLLKEVKAITTHEDIEVAEESLRKLLIDIKNPNYGLNDSDLDLHETAQVSGILDGSFESRSSRGGPRSKVSDHSGDRPKLSRKSRRQSLSKQSQNESSPQNDSDSSGKRYNLRSREKSTSEKESPKPVKIIRKLDIKANFFTNLNLQQVPTACTDTAKDGAPEGTNVERGPIIFSSGNGNDETDKSLIHCPNTVNPPSIVRNFTRCPEFEAKLKNTVDKMSQDEHDDCLDYDECYDNTSVESDEYEYEDEDEEKLRNDPNITQVSESLDLDMADSFITSSPKPVDSSRTTKSNDTFKYMIRLFLQEVKNAINGVKILCDKCYEELRNPQLPAVQRNELRKQIENARLHVTGLCISLESMLDRNSNEDTDNIKNALAKAGVDMSDIDQELLRKYWNTVANCKKYADVFLFSIQEIIVAFKSRYE